MTAVAMGLDERGAWTFEIGNGIEVRLGANSVDERTARFFRALDGVLAHAAADVAYVDMRYPNGFAIGWKSEAAVRAASAGEPRPNA
jgi:cell division protein FtsQ